MRKTVYSLVLTPEIIDAVDRMAYAQGTSRSNLIDKILAEAVGYVTPQQQVQQIFDTILQGIGGEFRMQDAPAGDWMTLCRQLRYRYKPTVRYRVEVLPHSDAPTAILQASFRTQSAELLTEVNEFFRVYSLAEVAYGVCSAEQIRRENGKWSRLFPISHAELRQPALLGERMAGYIRRFDGLLQQYFSALPNRRAAVSLVTDAFVSELQ
ncbi:MAG: hypothetical protein IJC75_00550 [Oscillospiraceae bacterium]|nr:hypothetical protein [Oscillospiraceae bacterium]